MIRAHVSETLARIAAYDDPAVWIHRATEAAVWAQVDRALERRRQNIPQPLLGLTVAVKDNIDVALMPTTSACPDFSYSPPASATAVQRLIDAGAIVMGKTNLDQFATGLVGMRSPYGACRNVFDPEYIAGGSSSGSAVAVAAGLVDFSLGTDTAGSGRVPAAFNSLVGLKPTCGIVSTSGVVPACRSLDCISVFTQDCRLAGCVLDVMRGFDPTDIYSRAPEEIPPVAMPDIETGGEFRFGIPDDADLEFFGNAEADWLYRRSIARAATLGGRQVTIDFKPFREAARLLYEGPWIAERYCAIKSLLAAKPESLLPVTRGIIAAAEKFSAADVFEAEYRLRFLRRKCQAQWGAMDVLLLPTTGTIYRRSEVEADPVRLNQNLGYYTNFVNLLDLSALALPGGFAHNGLPAGVTFMAPAGGDELLLAIGRRFEAATILDHAVSRRHYSMLEASA